jgi:glutathione S-transferase
MEYTSPLYMGFFGLIMSKDKEGADTAREELEKNLLGLSSAKTQAPWFNGDEFSLVDIAAAPFFVRALFVKNNTGIDLLKGHDSLQEWSDKLLVRQSVIDSTVEGFDDMMLMRMEKMGSYLFANK